MTTDLWKRTQELFEQAAALAPDECARFLGRACGADVELRREVEALLRSRRRIPDRFLQPRELQQVAGRTQPDVLAGLLGQQVGQYRIQRVINTGGMGTVYEAEQAHPQRSVALKMMSRALESPSALRRFQFEVETLARLHHPCIAQIFEAGVHRLETGATVPYFAMEYVADAKTLTEYASAGQLDLRARLELFAKVCDAVHHGHQRGVIHRDLKPANILVSDEAIPARRDRCVAIPKVIDFGVARATDADLAVTQNTNLGDLIGTMQYMSPEQCDADPRELDTRSDVYALGVVLFELLTGQLPYDAATTTIYHATQVIKEEPPQRPSLLDRRLRGDVETIVLKALEKDRERRYQSAADLGADIRRYLQREPIAARPPTPWNRVARWAARHPIWLTAAACAILVATSLSTIATDWWLRRRPDKLVVTAEGHEASLKSYADVLLQRWTSEGDNKVTFNPPMIPRPGTLGGGRLMVLGFRRPPSNPRVAALSAYAIDQDYRTPLWEGRILPADVPPQPSSGAAFVAEDCTVALGIVADVFEDPGPEIVVLYTAYARTHTAVRIYGLDGAVLYQIWVDAQIKSLYWMSEPGLLVCAGLNGRNSMDERGHAEKSLRDPAIVFAVRPRRDQRMNEYLAQEIDEIQTAPERLRPAWHFCVQNPPGGPAFGLVLKSQTAYSRLARPDAQVCVSATFKTAHGNEATDAAVEWVLDAAGGIIEQSITTDVYRWNLREFKRGDPRRLPEPEEWTVGALPPVSSQPTSSPASAPVEPP